MIYFDNAATSFPKPQAVKNAVDEVLLRYGANPGRSGHTLAAETAEKVYETRERVAAFFGAGDVEEVVFALNCTHAINMVLKGILCRGDHVIISDLEHNAVLRPVHAMAEQGIIEYSIAETFDDTAQTVASFENAIRPNTKVIISMHASNVFGIKLPIEALGAMAKKHGIYFVVDAAQTAGIEPIHMQDMKIDFLCVAGHKGLYGPSGTGLLLTPYGAKLRPLIEGGTGSVSYEYAQPDFMPDHLESGTMNTMGVLGLGAGLDFVTRCKPQCISQREMQVLCCIYEALKRCEGIKLYTDKPAAERQVAVLSFNLEGLTSEETAALLNEAGFAVRAGLQCAPLAHKKFGTIQGGTVRVSVGAFNTVEQGYAFGCAMQKIARQHWKDCKFDTKKD